MKLSLSKILKELFPDVGGPPVPMRTKLKPLNGPKSIMRRMYNGKPHNFYYQEDDKGKSMLHREEGPAILPVDAPQNVPTYEGGEYFLYGKKLSLPKWGAAIEKIKDLRMAEFENQVTVPNHPAPTPQPQPPQPQQSQPPVNPLGKTQVASPRAKR